MGATAVLVPVLIRAYYHHTHTHTHTHKDAAETKDDADDADAAAARRKSSEEDGDVGRLAAVAAATRRSVRQTSLQAKCGIQLQIVTTQSTECDEDEADYVAPGAWRYARTLFNGLFSRRRRRF